MKKKSIYLKKVESEDSTIGEMYDVFDEDTIDDYEDIETSRNIDKLEEDVPFIDESEAENYLADNFEEEDQEIIQNSEEIPVEEDKTGDIPVFNNVEEALFWAIDNNKVLKISYITQGRKKRKGIRLKREMNLSPGTEITRIIEPHDIFIAKTGNRIVVTYDRSVRGIRAFIIKNILNYIFTDKGFKKRKRINPSKIKGIKAMNIEIFEQLKNIGDTLENKGLSKSANIITKTMSNLLEIKTAQYVGAQGYLIRGKRCWDNCYRQKRAKNPNKPAQEVWTDCWGEYLKSINDNNSGWEKYASENVNLLKFANSEQKNKVKLENLNFIKIVDSKVSKGLSRGEAIYSSFNESRQKEDQLLLKNIKSLSLLSKTLKGGGFNDLSEKVANISLSIIKEADFADKQNILQKGWNWLTRNKPDSKANVIKRLQNVLTRIDEIVKMILPTGGRMASFTNLVKTADYYDFYDKADPSKLNIQQQPQTQQQSQQQNRDKTSPQSREASRKYSLFVDDLKSEMGILVGFANKNRDNETGQLLREVISAGQIFVEDHEKLFSSGNELNFKSILPFLQKLRKSVIWAITELSKQEEIDINNNKVPDSYEVDTNNNNVPDSQEIDTRAAIQNILKDPTVAQSLVLNSPDGQKGLINLVNSFYQNGISITPMTIGQLISSIKYRSPDILNQGYDKPV